MKYLIDSNSLISPYRTFYQFEVIPSFWKWFKQTYDESIFLVDKVRDELCHAKEQKSKDHLQLWVEENCLAREKIILPNTDKDVLLEYAKVLQYVENSSFYTQKSFDTWAGFEKADPWLVAIAKAHNYVIVTMEERNRNLNAKNPTSKEPRIPDVCANLGVRCINLFDLMQEMCCII
jgi:hypothetical protein